ncbi:hypothetical protein [Bradyrhizobium sp. AZCC 2289]|uniref:hypothetical protein n=1 Tax=Bradyrhizobium sp. AZCC 2289 TaxID=3117026 RepID=UPI002FF324C5
MRWMLTPVGLEPFDAEAREFHRGLSSGEPFAAQVIEIEALHDRDMVEHRRIMATVNDLAMRAALKALTQAGITKAKIANAKRVLGQK